MDSRKVKEAQCISKVIGKYVPLQIKGGKGYGLCPFHDDHHPSLVVDLKKQHFVCYACGTKGDVFSFIQQIEKCTFFEALQHLSKDILIDNDSKRYNSIKINKSIQSNTNKTVNKYDDKNIQYKNNLFLKSLMPYISKNKDLIQTYLSFEVGLSNVLSKDNLKTMDNRIIFPIRNDDNYLVGFAARRIDNDAIVNSDKINDNHTVIDDNIKQSPKYINSSLADGYKKSETLYALHRAKNVIRETGEVYLTEGYKDALAMHAAGFTNTVAICGTTLTDGQLQLLKKCRADKVYVLLDADQAGIEATDKIILLFGKEGIEAVPVCLPEGEDPDSFFCRIGCDAFKEYIKEASPERTTKEKLLNQNQNYGSTRMNEKYVCETLLQSIIRDLNREYKRSVHAKERCYLSGRLLFYLNQYSEVSQALDRPGAL